MKQSVLKVEHLSKAYGKKLVLRDISLFVRQGESVGLLGPNGAG
ncbi:MAG: ABC transporter ATP-binding protein, partial [Rickettsiales bacterium]|nr:ABC transporter ATP-binding protein [Rickettsiales bacterium]